MRNLHIYYSIIIGNNKLKDVARLYKISTTRVRQIVLKEAQLRAPILYSELQSGLPCIIGSSTGPMLLTHLREFADQFAYGEI